MIQSSSKLNIYFLTINQFLCARILDRPNANVVDILIYINPLGARHWVVLCRRRHYSFGVGAALFHVVCPLGRYYIF